MVVPDHVPEITGTRHPQTCWKSTTTTTAAPATTTNWSTWKATRASPPAIRRAGPWARHGRTEHALRRCLAVDPGCHRRHAAAQDRRRVRKARIPESIVLDQGAHRLVHDREGRTERPAATRRQQRQGNQKPEEQQIG